MECKLPFERKDRKILIKRDSETDWRFGKSPEKGSVEELIMHGVVNLNKPAGPS